MNTSHIMDSHDGAEIMHATTSIRHQPTNWAFLATPCAGKPRTAYRLHSIDKFGNRDWRCSAMEHLWYGAHVSITCSGT